MSEGEQQTVLLREINDRLGQLVALTAMAQISGLSQKDKVEKLGSVGLSASAISDITGYSISSVAPILSRFKAPNSKKPKKS